MTLALVVSAAKVPFYQVKLGMTLSSRLVTPGRAACSSSSSSSSSSSCCSSSSSCFSSSSASSSSTSSRHSSFAIMVISGRVTVMLVLFLTLFVAFSPSSEFRPYWDTNRMLSLATDRMALRYAASTSLREQLLPDGPAVSEGEGFPDIANTKARKWATGGHASSLPSRQRALTYYFGSDGEDENEEEAESSAMSKAEWTRRRDSSTSRSLSSQTTTNLVTEEGRDDHSAEQEREEEEEEREGNMTRLIAFMNSNGRKLATQRGVFEILEPALIVKQLGNILASNFCSACSIESMVVSADDSTVHYGLFDPRPNICMLKRAVVAGTAVASSSASSPSSPSSPSYVVSLVSQTSNNGRFTGLEFIDEEINGSVAPAASLVTSVNNEKNFWRIDVATGGVVMNFITSVEAATNGIVRHPSQPILFAINDRNDPRVLKIELRAGPAAPPESMVVTRGAPNISSTNGEAFKTFNGPFVNAGSISSNGSFLYIADMNNFRLIRLNTITNATEVIVSTQKPDTQDPFYPKTAVLTSDGCNLFMTGREPYESMTIPIEWLTFTNPNGPLLKRTVITRFLPMSLPIESANNTNLRPPSQLTRLALSRDEKHLYVGSDNGEIFKLEMNPKALHRCAESFPQPSTSSPPLSPSSSSSSPSSPPSSPSSSSSSSPSSLPPSSSSSTSSPSSTPQSVPPSPLLPTSPGERPRPKSTFRAPLVVALGGGAASLLVLLALTLITWRKKALCFRRRSTTTTSSRSVPSSLVVGEIPSSAAAASASSQPSPQPPQIAGGGSSFRHGSRSGTDTISSLAPSSDFWSSSLIDAYGLTLSFVARKLDCLDAPRPIPFADLNQATEGFSPEYKVAGARGGFGDLYRASMKLGDGEEVNVALKLMRGAFSEVKRKQFVSEVTTLSSARHVHLCKLLGYCIEGNMVILVYPFIAGGSLFDRLHPRQECTKEVAATNAADAESERPPSSSPSRYPLSLDWRSRVYVVQQIATALRYLHEELDPPLLHRDVKSSNVLVDGNGEQVRAYLTDFGLARLGNPSLRGERGRETVETLFRAGTIGYMAPEYAIGLRLTPKNDVYALGVILLEVVTGKKAIFFDGEASDGDGGDGDFSEDNPVLLSRWCKRRLLGTNGLDYEKVKEMVDPQLVSDFEIYGANQWDRATLCGILELGCECTRENASHRPVIGFVLERIKTLVEMRSH